MGAREAPARRAGPQGAPLGGGAQRAPPPPLLSESMAALADWSAAAAAAAPPRPRPGSGGGGGCGDGGGGGGSGGGGGGACGARGGGGSARGGEGSDLLAEVARGLGDAASRHAVLGVLQLVCARSCRVQGALLQAAASAPAWPEGAEGCSLEWGDARAAVGGLHPALRGLCFGAGTAAPRAGAALRLALAAEPSGGDPEGRALPREYQCLPQLQAAADELGRLWAGLGGARSRELCAQLWDGLRWAPPGLLPHVAFALGAFFHEAAADASSAGSAVLRMLLEDLWHLCEAVRGCPPQLLRVAAFVLAMDLGAALGPAARARAGPAGARALAGAAAALAGGARGGAAAPPAAARALAGGAGGPGAERRPAHAQGGGFPDVDSSTLRVRGPTPPHG